MGNVVIILLLGIVILLWKANSKSSKNFDQLIEVIEAQKNTMYEGLSIKDYLHLILNRNNKIVECSTQILSIATKENPAGANFHEFVRSDNLATIYADYLERYENLPQDLAMKRARFEVAMFGQEAVIRKINSDYSHGVERQRERKDYAEFFSSGIIEKDIKSRLERTIIPHDLLAPLYDLIVQQDYSGEKDFAADLTTYTIETYEEMVERAAIISKLEQLGILMRNAGENWGAYLRFRLKSTDMSELRELIYSGELAHDDEHFEERFNEGGLPRIFEAHDLGLLL